MPKITEYPKATSFDANDVLLKDGTNGTKKIEIEDFITDVSDTTNGTAGKLARASDFVDIKNAFYTATEHVAWTPTIYKGEYLRSDNGVLVSDSSSTARKMARTGLWNGFGYRIAVNLNNANYEYRVIYYNENGDLTQPAGSNGFVGRSEYASGVQYIPSNAILFGLSIRRIDGSDMTDAHVSEISAALSAYATTDTTLTKRGIAADAKYTGDAIALLDSNLSYRINEIFTTSYTPSNLSVDANGKPFMEYGYVNASTGAASTISSSSVAYQKYMRSQAGANGANNFMYIGNKPVLITLGLADVEWTCWSYSGATNATATHSNCGNRYISGTTSIYVPHNDTDVRMAIGFRTIGNGDSNRQKFTEEQISAIKDNLKMWVFTDDSLSIVGSPADAKAVGDAITSIQTGIAKEATRLGLHTIPDNAGVLNAIKRARQLTDIKWTPKFDIPFRYFGSYGPDGNSFYLYGGFKAGTEYTGIPYSEHRWVGCLWPFSAFVTSLYSDKTHLATFVPGSGAADHADSTFYGVVCSVLVAYAINRPGSKSDSFLHVNGLSQIGPINESTIDDIRLGDILYKSTHVSIITDIIKDENGHVTDAEISEATSAGLENYNDLWGKYGGLCKRVMYKKADFLSKVSTYSLCRYAYIDKVPYEYTNYSALVTDGNYESIGNYPILPIQGNLVKTNSTSTRLIITMDATEDTREHTIPTMTHVIVWRNGEVYGDPLEIQTQAQDEVVAWDSAAGSTVTIKAGTRYVMVTADADDEAVFSACMATVSNGSAVSWGRACRWFKYGPTKTYIPAGRTVYTSSGGYKYLNKLSDGTHEFTIRRKSTEFIPYAVSFGNISDNLGALNGYSSNIYDYTVSEVTENNETWYEYHFKVIPPTITSPHLVPAIVSWKSQTYGVIEISATLSANIVGNDGYSLFYYV